MTILRTRTRGQGVPHLAAEILESIFECLKSIEPVAGKTRSSLFRRKWVFGLGWMKVIHVCRMWREVCINHSILWTDHPDCMISNAWMKRILDYSAWRPSTLIVDHSTRVISQSLSSVDLISDHLAHIQNLSIDQQTAQRVFSTQTIDAPMLESLALTPGKASEGLALIIHHRHLLFGPPTQTCRLKSLKITGVSTWFHTSWFDQLTHLEVVLPFFNSNHRWSLSYLQSALEAAIQLETLILEYILPLERDTTVITKNDRTPLAKSLRVLKIHDHPATMMGFLDTITIPSTTACKLESAGEHGLPETLDDLVDNLFKPSLQPPQMLSFTQVEYSGKRSSSAWLSIRLWNSPFFLLPEDGSYIEPCLEYTFYTDALLSDVLRELSICLTVQFSQVETLHLGCIPHDRWMRRNRQDTDVAEAMESLLKSVPHIRTIFVQNCSTAYRVLSALIKNLGEDSEIARCPGLTRLQFINLAHNSVPRKLQHLLRKYLLARRAIGGSLEQTPLETRICVDDPRPLKNAKWLVSLKVLGIDIDVY